MTQRKSGSEVLPVETSLPKRSRLDAHGNGRLTKTAAQNAGAIYRSRPQGLQAGRDDLPFFPRETIPALVSALTSGQPRPGETSNKLRLSALAMAAVGEKRLREAKAKRARARRRQQRHTWSLRATKGLTTVLEELAMSSTISGDYQKRLNSFWDFVDMFLLPVKSDRDIDCAAADWADLEFLSGEGYEAGEKLLAALDRWALVMRSTGVPQLPRMKRVLKSWRKNAPRRSRLPMPEEFMWLSAGTLGFAGYPWQAVFQKALFATYLRPSALFALYTDDVVCPLEGPGHRHHVLVVSPIEREKATKAGQFDETVLLDGTVCPALGPLLEELVTRRRDDEGVGADEPVRLWGFHPREFYNNWKGATMLNGLTDMETVHQARHGGASRDMLLKERAGLEIQLRLHHATASSTRIYNKPGRIQKLVSTLDAKELQYVSLVKANFESYVRSGGWPRPPKAPSAVTLS